ncbi:MAG: FAD-binding oxidoreductase [Flavobacteriaceae bacterium]|nr:FAD-binding oxidoreductase [Flavobacteriaceae bacterium]
MVDVIIVGLGVAGMAMCESLRKNNKSFVVFDDDSQTSSNIAGGMYNPVVLKRFTGVWRAAEQLAIAKTFYRDVAQILGSDYDIPLKIFRKFASIEEQNRWFEACDKPHLRAFLATQLVQNNNQHLKAPYHFGEVKNTGRVDIGGLLKHYMQFLESQKQYFPISFEHQELIIEPKAVCYKEWKAQTIVFAEGFGLKKNPFFNYLPLHGAKGQLLTVKAPGLHLDAIYKAAAFFIPLGDDTYKVGATYEHGKMNNQISEDSKELLLERIQSLTDMPLEVIRQEAGVRPTVKDRKPLVGQHPLHQNMYLLNGMGSRGVMIAPFAAQLLYQQIYDQKALPSEMDIRRFEKEWIAKTP